MITYFAHAAQLSALATKPRAFVPRPLASAGFEHLGQPRNRVHRASPGHAQRCRPRGRFQALPGGRPPHPLGQKITQKRIARRGCVDRFDRWRTVADVLARDHDTTRRGLPGSAGSRNAPTRSAENRAKVSTIRSAACSPVIAAPSDWFTQRRVDQVEWIFPNALVERRRIERDAQPALACSTDRIGHGTGFVLHQQPVAGRQRRRVPRRRPRA